MDNSRRVYSSGDGRIRPPVPARSPAPTGPPAPNDGVVRIFRDRSGRNGKVVTVIRGLPVREVEERAAGAQAALRRRRRHQGRRRRDPGRPPRAHRRAPPRTRHTVKLAWLLSDDKGPRFGRLLHAQRGTLLQLVLRRPLVYVTARSRGAALRTRDRRRPGRCARGGSTRSPRAAWRSAGTPGPPSRLTTASR